MYAHSTRFDYYSLCFFAGVPLHLLNIQILSDISFASGKKICDFILFFFSTAQKDKLLHTGISGLNIENCILKEVIDVCVACIKVHLRRNELHILVGENDNVVYSNDDHGKNESVR